MAEWSRYANEDDIPLTRRKTFKEPQGFDYQTFEGVFYPDAQTVRYKGTTSTVKQALDELGYRGSLVADESGVATAFYHPEDLRSIHVAFDPARASSSDLLAGVAPWAVAGGLGLLAGAMPGESRADKLSREMTHREPSRNVSGLERLQAGLQAGGATPVPVASDVMGLLGDALMYYNDPSSRTWTDYGGTALGLLPFVP